MTGPEGRSAVRARAHDHDERAHTLNDSYHTVHDSYAYVRTTYAYLYLHNQAPVQLERKSWTFSIVLGQKRVGEEWEDLQSRVGIGKTDSGSWPWRQLIWQR